MPLTQTPEELSAWLRLTLEPGIGAAVARELLKRWGPPQQIFALPPQVLADALPAPLAGRVAGPPSADLSAAIERTLRWAEAPGHHLLTLADAGYPQALLDIHDPPPVLYVAGDPTRLAHPAIAIVGARHATPEGLANARAFARHLGRQGWCIVSGMALGIDTAAHEGALEAEGTGGTVAVVGTGADVVYPARNRDLSRRIAAAGAILSEFPLGSPALPHQFPRRNRLVAGLARGTLVAEAAARSGSLITARLAADTGREVFAIPGSIHSPLSRGCHTLIRQGAKLVESAQDILDELQGTPAAIAPETAPDASLPHDALLTALGYGPVHLDTLAARAELAIPELQARLLELELQGRVVRLDGGRYQRRAAP
ncbi:MAG: DNA-processing protein DprA [Pigmentiphaga sp.]|uniref:DNA-processing protein DprA n=1 Tax=Pigmentiphaga sp. TaxID=1977564 RepID=UPI0029B7372A|nr:DNA-processing protein DprA [Pigmentiphaga sp.]MDX3906023.1 DNA-processing protein DprA [Pigmentiphaga sp.]